MVVLLNPGPVPIINYQSSIINPKGTPGRGDRRHATKVRRSEGKKVRTVHRATGGKRRRDVLQ